MGASASWRTIGPYVRRYRPIEYSVSAMASTIEMVPTMPLNNANACHALPRHPCSIAAEDAMNQKKAAPTQIIWKVVFHLPGPSAAMTRPRFAAYCRNNVIMISRSTTTARIQRGSPTRPSGVTNG